MCNSILELRSDGYYADVYYMVALIHTFNWIYWRAIIGVVVRENVLHHRKGLLINQEAGLDVKHTFINGGKKKLTV